MRTLIDEEKERKRTHPLSPPLSNVESSTIATQSTLPSTNLTGPFSIALFLLTILSSSSIPSSSIAPSNTFLNRLAPPPRNTS